jgi:cytochrome c-type biogenesis protein CcmH
VRPLERPFVPAAPARAAAFTVLLLSLLLGGAVPAHAVRAHASLPDVERQVMCVTCKIPLNLAESPQADRERAFVRDLIERGQSEAQIKRALVGQYGSAVLALPAADGFSLLVYLVPAAVLLAFVGALALLLPRWRRRGRQEDSPAPPTQLAPADAARLDADLARFE